ncbi:MAG: GNAT family N-acetyltransferase [Hymenobacteraceae bacterium]|nr:GNAT family N-acetyltransferase [Hymenobacteraceae bacterium]
MELFPDSTLPLPAAFGAYTRHALRPILNRVTGLGEMQRLYERIAHLHGAAFIDAVLRELDITVEFDPAELRRLPATGAFVAVANHPSGILDGLALLHVLHRVRPDVVAVATERLRPLYPVVGEHLLLIETTDAAHNTGAVRELLRRLHNDIPLLLFPAGEVAHPRAPFGPTVEAAWHPTAGRVLTRARVPIVPVWVSGRNSAGFGWLSLLHPLLRTARLPAELLNKRGQTIRVRLGQPVRPADFLALPTEQRLRHLRARVLALGAASCGSLPLNPPATGWMPGITALGERWLGLVEDPLPGAIEETDTRPLVVAETAPELLEADLARLRPGRLLVHSRHWEVYVAKAAEIPNVLREIGRLRELTFRAVGEGTGHALDLDAYDEYYRHLFLYDRAARCLVGAYRLGPGRAILRTRGKRGLYLHSLFRLRPAFKPFLREAVELGRSWVRAEYQRQPLPLALLWKGLATWLARHPDYHYLIGPVSISNRFSDLSKALLTHYLERHFFDDQLARHVRPRKPFRYHPPADFDAPDPAALLPSGPNALDTLDRLVAAIEPGGLGVPVLLRQYLRQNGRLIGFNRDPAFSNALDGLLVLDARQLPARTHELLKRA